MAVRRPRLGGNENIAGAIIISFVLFIVLGAIAGFWYFSLNTQSVCQPDTPGPLLIVLVDATDDIPPVHRDSAIDYVRRLIEQAPRGARVSLFQLNEDENNPVTSILSLCNSGRGRDVSPLVESRGVAEAQFRAQFQRPLTAAFESSVQNTEADASPIMEALQRIAVATDDTGAAGPRQPAYILILSDMIQHSHCLSQYREEPDFRSYQSTDCYRLLHASLNRAHVCVRLVPRANQANVQSQSYLERFWAGYFRDMDAAPGFAFCSNPTDCHACDPVWN